MDRVSPVSSFAIDVPHALLARARAGEAAAFEQLYRWFERPVYALAMRLTGRREEAQDILQDTMLKLFDRIGEFRGDAPFWGWLRQIAVNESLMLLRRRGRFLTDGDADESALPDENLMLPPRAADAAIDGLWQTLILAGIQEVTPLDAEFLTYEIGGYFGMIVAAYRPA